ncbi:MAG TPA: ribose-phosphate pyrophosphokinase [Cyanobacteria bacterium UBA10660]|nr:ribose-phosphate pyrophosphokinase [Clostridium sp. CAG:813]DAA83380.1 MAG TPA: ribose-phosphate pyrophosphokinase [Candidatus Gastranaerophilales bacterium HUM_1]HAS94477.1 ribose-phosphate pyrophosphokinase [Cyanobacteria bacterium UBA10660]
MVAIEEKTYSQLERAINPTHDIKLFAGRSNPKLAQEIADQLGTTVGPMVVKNFSDGEIYVQVKESVRGDDVFIIQPVCNPVNENLMELLIIIDAFKRASAKTITAVIPYYGYARQDRKTSGREAITAKLVADLLTTAGANRVLAMDLHTGQIQGFFNILVDHIFATNVLVNYIKDLGIPTENMVAVSPDMGGANRTRHFAKKLDIPIAIIDKRRDKHNEAIATNVIGDVENKVCLMFDDIIDTAGTICEAAKLLKSKGAKDVYVGATHPVFSGPAVERLASAPIKECIVTNTIPLDMSKMPSNIKQISVAPLLAQAISRIHDDESISSLFGFEKEMQV